jgi:hypothetical protein
MNDKTKSIGWRVAGAVAGVFFAPFVLFSTYLVFTRWPHRIDNGAGDWFALIISSLAGAAFMGLLPIRYVLRAALAAVYVPLSCVALFFYTFYFVGMVFGDWL